MVRKEIKGETKMAQARKIETYENKTKTVKKPEAVINHKQTKQYKDGETTVVKKSSHLETLL